MQFEEGEINFLHLDEPLCYTDEELLRLLGKGLILDNVAAGHLQDRGFGEYLGCTLEGEVPGPVMELLDIPDCAGAFAGCALPTAWNELRRKGLFISRLSQLQGRSVSTLLDEEWQPLAPGTSVFHNKLGGCVCVTACPIHTISWLHRGRAAQMRGILRAMENRLTFPLVEDAPNIAPFYYCRAGSDERFLALVNCGLDGQTALIPKGFASADGQDGSSLHLPPLSVHFLQGI